VAGKEVWVPETDAGTVRGMLGRVWRAGHRCGELGEWYRGMMGMDVVVWSYHKDYLLFCI